MAVTSDDIERLLARIEDRQVRCPECGGTDAHMKIPYYELSEVRFTMTGEIMVGEQYDSCAVERKLAPPLLVCHNDQCKHEWPVPEGITLQWESVICECHEAKLRRTHDEMLYLSAQEPACENVNCDRTAVYVIEGTRTDGIPYGQWYHVDTRGLPGERACAVKAKGANGTEYTQYCRVTLG